MRYTSVLLLLVMLMAAGCATGDSPTQMSQADIAKARAVDEYAPPAITPPTAQQLKLVVNKSVNQVCRAIDAYAASSPAVPFVLTHNIYKTSNSKPATATIMLNVADPEICVDCGFNRFAFYEGDQLVKQWEYEVAVKEMVLAFDEHDSLSRFMSVVGQANLNIKPLGNGRTEITVDIDYVLERKVTAYTARQLGNERVIMPITGISVLKFNTLEPGTMEDSVICVSRGVMEKQILDGIKANLK